MFRLLTQPLPAFLYKKSSQTTFIIFVAVFSLIFINAYKPFNSFEWIPYIRFRGSNAAYFLISVAMVTVGILVLVLSRMIMTAYSRRRPVLYWVYILWIAVETLVMTSIYTLYAVLSNGEPEDYMLLWKNTVINTVLVLSIPYAIYIIYISWREKDRQLRQITEQLENDAAPSGSGHVQIFSDKGELQLSIAENSLVMIESADNYVCVWYLNHDKIKKAMIRNTMKNIVRDLADSNIRRCHRSYSVNLDHVKVMRREPSGIVIEMDIDGVPDIPISKTYSESITRWLMQ